MNILELLKLSFINLFYLLGGFIGFGLIFDRIEYLNNKLIFSTFGKMGVIITGFIGTVVHELSHFIMCLIFGHKVTEVKLFRPIAGQSDGLLGYVSHSYNKNNLYQTTGNFFIGIAPLIGGTITIIILFKLLLPNTYQSVVDYINLNEYIKAMNSFNVIGVFKIFINDMGFVVRGLFFNKDIFSIRYLIFIFSMYSISTHMSLSSADLKGSLSGLSVIFVIVLVFTFITSLLGANMSFLSTILIKYNVFVVLFMLIGLFFSLLTLTISYIFSMII